MADGGIGEAALLSAAIGGGMSAVQGRDPLQGALMGGLLGGLGGAAFGGAEGLAGETVLDASGNQLVSAGTAGQAPVYDALGNAPGTVSPITGGTSLTSTPLQSANISQYSDFGQANPFASAAPTTNGIVGAQGGQNVLQNQLGATVGGAPVNPMYTDMPATGIGGAGSTPLMSTPTAAATGVCATPMASTGSGISNLLDTAGSYLPETTAGKAMLGGGLGLAYLMNKERQQYGVPAAEKYTGPLSKFSYNPSTYQPDIVRPPSPLYHAQYAAGGPVEMMSNNAAIGANTMYPMANMATSAFATPYQTPQSTNMMQNMAPSGGGTVNMMSGEPNMQGTRMASGGGISSLGSYSDGGRMLKGPGDGMSDSIPARIGSKQEARLADGEFVVSADVVSGLGNGSTDAGAKQLYKMMDKVRSARTGTKKQGKQIKPERYLPA